MCEMLLMIGTETYGKEGSKYRSCATQKANSFRVDSGTIHASIQR